MGNTAGRCSLAQFQELDVCREGTSRDEVRYAEMLKDVAKTAAMVLVRMSVNDIIDMADLFVQEEGGYHVFADIKIRSVKSAPAFGNRRTRL
jgi:hypothetical protein